MNRLYTAIGYAGAALISALTLLTGLDIAGRYLFDSPLLGTFELTEVTLVVIGALGICLTTVADEHIAVDVLYEQLPSRWRRILRLCANLVGIVIFGILAWQSTYSVWRSIFVTYETTDLLAVPLYPFRLVLLISFFISLLALISRLVGLPPWEPRDSGQSDKDTVV
jgi:TRAP-type C4-dicarboxylate transport system permease small subunit